LDPAAANKFSEFFEETPRYRVAFACPKKGLDGVQNYDDFELVAAATAGELEAFGELIRRHQDFVYGSVLRVVKNPTLAEDVSQDCFLRAYRALPDFRGDSQVRSWLYRIAHNLALNAVTRRREYPTDTMPETLASSASGPARSAEINELGTAIDKAIETLPEDLKQPLVLRELQHMTYEDIAAELDLPLNTVRTRIFRARRALQTHMKDWQ
jgi:RNA polymerase sigma-70 factor (ECF subfamily)